MDDKLWISSQWTDIERLLVIRKITNDILAGRMKNLKRPFGLITKIKVLTDASTEELEANRDQFSDWVRG